MPVTIKDVARMAGVSISTVSRVINDSKPVSSGIKAKVEKVIKETGYVPNPVARSLVMRKSHLIGVIVPGIKESLIGEFLSGVEEIARMYNYDIILCNSYGEKTKEESYINLLRSKQVAGIIYITDDIKKDTVNKIKAMDIPMVYFSPNAKSFKDIYTVDIDQKEATKELVSILTEDLDKKRFIYIKDNEKGNLEEDQKEALVENAITKLKLKKTQCKVLQSVNEVESAYKVAMKSLKSKQSVGAILAATDEIALGSIYAVNDCGLKVPEDVKIAKFYDSKLAKMLRPSITCISKPQYDMGAVATRIIVKTIEDEPMDKNKVVLPYKIMQRDSTSK